jgi:hypothetical protein
MLAVELVVPVRLPVDETLSVRIWLELCDCVGVTVLENELAWLGVGVHDCVDAGVTLPLDVVVAPWLALAPTVATCVSVRVCVKEGVKA